MCDGASLRVYIVVDLDFPWATSSIGALSSFEESGGWGKEFEEHLLLLQLLPPSPYLRRPFKIFRASPTLDQDHIPGTYAFRSKH